MRNLQSAAQIWMFARSAASALIKRPLGLALNKKRQLDLFSNEIGADETGSLEKEPSAFVKWPPALIKWAFAFDKMAAPLQSGIWAAFR